MGFRRYMLLAFVAGAVAGPINVEDGNQKCARTCTESLSDNAKFQYSAGTTYQFSYAGEAVTRLEGSSKDSSALKIAATADVEVLSQCEFSLKLRNVQLLENGQTSSTSAAFSQRLEASALRFSFQDGKVESLCPDAGEDDRVLNLKKGILSAFQNSLPTLESSSAVEEVDVTGSCSSQYQVEKGILGGYTVKRSKDLLSCVNRNGNISSLQSESYRVPSSVQSLPLMRCTHNCEQKISGGILQSAVCKEEHVFRPFSKQSSGAKTVVESSLKLEKARSGVTTRMEPVQRRTSLLFQHSYDAGVDANARDTVVAALSALCDQTREDVRPETPEHFSRLVYAMKKLSLESMADIKDRVASGRICSSARAKKFFMDAVPLVGTAASVAFTRDLLKDGTINGAEADMWLTQLAFIQQPTVQMLAEVKPLLEDGVLRSKAALGVSSLVHKVCTNMVSCQRHPDVAAIVRSIEEMLGSNCDVNDAESRMRVMYALKALGNAGRAVTSSSIISACAMNTNIEADIRVAALQAFRRVQCSADRGSAMSLFQNAQEDAEIRINAYLAVMSCPSSDSLLKVKMALSGEVVNQVGSFVWTHLTNLQETASIFKQDIRNILHDAKLREDYDCDARKYSHNYEKSFFSEYLNIGGQVESNVIFSQKSYVPRSAMLNLTVDMFGNSINLLEVGGRVQGLETILEKFFGKNGYFSQSNMKSIMRNKRDINHSIASIFDKIFKIRDDKLKGGLYMKALGNELFYKDLTSETFAQNGINFLDIMMRLSEPTDLDLTHSTMFLDASLIVPTMIGMPLNLTVDGTATLNLQIGGKADIRKAAASPRSLDITGHVKPSAAIVISGTMSVHGLTAQSSLKLVSTLHTSTAIEGKLQLQDGEVLNAELKVPKDKMEILSVESKILMNGVELQTAAEGSTSMKKCSGQWLGKVTGVELCAEASIPQLTRDGAPYYPLTGPLSAKVVLNKKDSINAYTFEARYQAPRVRQDGVDYVKRVARLSFDTPGSTVDRRMMVEFNLDQQKMAAGLNFITPWKKVSADSELVNLNDLKKAVVRLTIDGEKHYSGLAELTVDARKNKAVYSPRIELNIPGRDTMVASGAVELSNSWPLSIDVVIDKVAEQPIKLKGSLSKPGESIAAAASLDTQWIFAKVDGSIDNKKTQRGAMLSVEYSLAPGRIAAKRMSLIGKVQNLSSSNLFNHKGSLGLTATEFPWLEFGITASHQMSANHAESTLEIVHGAEKRVLAATHTMSKSSSQSSFEASMRTSVSYSQMFNIVADAKHKLNQNEISSSAEVSYGPSKTAKLSYNLSNRLSENGLAKGSIVMDLPVLQVQVDTELTKMADGEFAHTVMIQRGIERFFEMTNSLKISPARNYELSGNVHLQEAGGPVSYSSQIRLNPDDFVAKAELKKASKTYSAEASYRRPGVGAASGSARLSVPGRVSNMRIEMDVNGVHKTSMVELSTDDGQGNPLKVSLVGDYNNVDTDMLVSRDSSLTLTIPGTIIQISGNVRKAASNGAGTVDLSVGGQKSQLSAQYDLASDVRAQLRLQSPYIRYRGISDIDLELTHAGNAKMFTNRVSAGWAPQQKISIDTQLNMDAVSWSTDVKTPFSVLGNFGSSGSFNKDLSDLRIQGRAYVDGKEVSSEVSLRNTESGAASVVLPDGRALSAKFAHSFTNGKLKNKMEASWALGKEIVVDTNVGLLPDIAGTVSVSTPFALLRNAVLSVDHQGKSLNNFATVASFTWDGKQIKGEARHDSGKGSARLDTPWRALSAEGTYSRGTNTVSATGSLAWSANDKLTWSTSLDQSSGIAGRLAVTTPFAYLTAVEATLAHTGSLGSFETDAQLLWQQTNRISIKGKFANSPSIQGTFALTTPFAALPSVEAGFQHTGSLSSFTNQATLKYSTYEQLKFESKYSSAGGNVALQGIPAEKLKSLELGYTYATKTNRVAASAMAGWNGDRKVSLTAERVKAKNTHTVSFTLATPFSMLPQASGKVIHNGGLLAFTNQAELSWGERSKITTTSEFNRQASSAKLDATSPYGSLKFFHIGGLKEFTSSASVTAADNKVLASLQAALSTQAGVSANVAIVTPLEAAKSLAASVNHRGSWSDFKNHAEVSWGIGKLAAIDAQLKLGDSIVGEVKGVSPWSEASLTFSHEGKLANFGTKVALSWGNGQRAAITSRFNFVDAVSGEVGFSSSFKNLENITFLFEHKGELSKFNNRAQLSYGMGKDFTVASRFETTSSSISGEAELTSPYARAKVMHNGNLGAFANSAEIGWAENKMVAFTSRFASADGVDVAATFRSPFRNFEDLTLTAWHKGTVQASFKDYAEFSWAAGKKMSLDTTVDLSSGLTATMKFASPSQAVDAFLNHSGNLSSFTSNAGLSWASGKKMEASVEFSRGSAVTGQVTFSSPFDKLRNIRASFDHRNTNSGFETNASAEWSPSQRISARFAFGQLPDLKVRFSFGSPFGNVNALAEHSGRWRNFSNKAEIEWATDKKVTFTSEFSSADFGSGIRASTKFVSPFQNVEASLNHSGDLSSFNSKAAVSWLQDKKIEATVEFNNGIAISGKATLSSPFESIRNIALDFNHQKQTSGFETDANVIWSPTQKVSTRVTFAGLPDLKVAVSFNSPVLTVSSSAEHSGNLQEFANKAELSWAEDKKVVLASRFSRVSDVSLGATFRSPFKNFEELSFTARHSGSLRRSFANNAEISWATGKKMSLDTSADFGSGIRASTKFFSPFQNVEASLDHTGGLSSFNSKAGVSWSQDKKIEATVEFNNGIAISGKAMLSSPFDSIRNIALDFNHQKQTNGFETDANVIWSPTQKVSTRVTFAGLPDLKVAVSFNSPVMTVSSSAEHSGNWQEFANKAELTWAENKKIALTSRFSRVSDLSLGATFSSPFKNFEELSFTARHSGNLRQSFTSNAEISWATGKKMSLDTSADFNSGIRATARFASPFENIEASLNHSGNLQSFNSDAGLKWSGNDIQTAVQFKSSRDIEGKFTLNSSFNKLRSIEATFEHRPDVYGFETKAALSSSLSQKISASVLFRQPPSMELVVDFASPFMTITASANHSGDLRAFQNNAKLSWAENKKIEFASELSQGTATTFKSSFRSPFAKFESLSTELSHSTAQDVQAASMKVAWSAKAEDKISIDLSLNLSSGVHATVDFVSPFQNVKAAVEHTGDSSRFSSEAKLNWSVNSEMVAKITFSQIGGILGKLSFASPFRNLEKISAEFSHSGNFGIGCNCHAWLEYATGKRLTAELLLVSGAEYKYFAKITTPFAWNTLVASLNHKQNDSSLENIVELGCNNKSVKIESRYSNRDAVEVSQIVSTPFRGFEIISWSSNYAYTADGASGSLEVAVNNDKYRMDVAGKRTDAIQGSINISTPYASYKDNKVEGALKLTDKLLSLSISGQLGGIETLSHANLVLENTGNSDTSSAKASAVVNSPLLTKEQKAEFSYSFSSRVCSIAADVNALKQAVSIGATLTRAVSSEGLQTGSLDATYQWNGKSDAYRSQWEYGTVQTQHRSLFSVARDSRPDQKVKWTSKVSWAPEALEVEASLNTPHQAINDAKLQLKLSGNSREFSVDASASLTPGSAIEYKVDFSRRSDFRISSELKTPFEGLRSASVSIMEQKSASANTVNILASHNGKKGQLAGSFKAQSLADFDGSLEFTSSMPGYENIKMQISCKKMGNSLQPYASLSWAADKRIDVSGSFTMDRNSHKSTLDISTPFSSMSTLHAEISHVAQFPLTMSSRFDFKTNTMSEKLSVSASFNKESGSAELLLSSPWQPVRSLQLVARCAEEQSLRLDMNGTTVARANALWTYANAITHNGEITIDVPILNKYARVKFDNNLDSSAAEKMTNVEVEYSRGQVVSLKYSNKRDQGVVALVLTTPFPSVNFAYNVEYTGSSVDNWTERTRLTCSNLQFTSTTEFRLGGGLHLKHDCSLTYGGRTHTTSKTLAVSGDLSAFTATFTCRSSYMPAIDAEINWNASPIAAKAVVNGYQYDFSARRDSGSFQASAKVEFPLRSQKEAVVASANWLASSGGKITLTTPFEMLRSSEATIAVNDAAIVSSVKYAGFRTVAYQGSVSRSPSARITEGKISVDGQTPISWNGKMSLTDYVYEWDSFISGVRLNLDVKPTEGQITVRQEEGEGASVAFSNAINADGENVPLLTARIFDKNGSSKDYEVRGLYKNVGQGVVRDFKLHVVTPQGLSHAVDLKVEFSIKSNQFVPGDAIIQCFITNADGTVQRLINMNAEWGNDRITVTVKDPQPMTYDMSFSVNTKKQMVQATLNWDTTSPDSNIRIDMSRAGSANSQSLKETTEMRALYRGSSYGLKSELDWQRASASHVLKLEVLDKVFGYEVRMSKTSGKAYSSSIKLISPLRSVLLESSTEIDLSKRLGQSLYLSWDADRDASKKVGGEHVIRWENRKIQMETSFHHPALNKDVRIVDEIMYDTDGVIGSFKKTVDYSENELKKIVLFVQLANDRATFTLSQPYNNINIDISGNFRVVQDVYTMGGKLTYMTVDGSSKPFEISGSLDARAMLANVKIASPANTVLLYGQLKDQSSIEGKAYNIVVRGNSGSSAPLTTTIDLNEKAMTASVKVNYDSANQMALVAGRYNATSFSVELSRLNNGEQTIDGFASVTLNPDSIVSGRLYWNPENYVAIKSKVEKIRQYLKESIKAMHDGISSEYSSRQPAADAEMSAIAAYSRREVTLIKQDAAIVSQSASRLYDSDTLYVRSMSQALGRSLAKVQDKVAQLKEQYNNMAAAISEMYAPLVASVDSTVKAHWLQIQQELANMDEILTQVAGTFGGQLLEKSLAVSEKAARVGALIRNYIGYVASEASQHQSVELIRDFHSRAMSKFNAYSDAAATRISDVTSAISSRVVLQPEHVTKIFGDVYDFANDKARGYLAQVLNRDSFSAMGGAAAERVKNMYKDLDIEHHVSQVVMHAKELAREYMKSMLASTVDTAFDDTKWIRYDPATGHYEFDLHIPSMPADVNVEDVKVAVQSRVDEAVRFFQSYSPALKAFNVHLHRPSLAEILPPFDAYATISGQHIQTFDRRHYDFLGRCSYLLARDFENGNFSLIVNYNDKGKFSLSAINGEKTIELMGDGSVRIDGGKVELPVERVNTTVTKEGEKVKLVNSHGLTVTCDWSADYCSVHMSGWYFAKTAGLLGTYNNEGSDDFTTSDNRNVTDVVEFARSWKLSGSCPDVNTAATVNVPAVCSSMFEASSSPLSSCFSIIDPSMYAHVCADAAKQNKRNPHCVAAQLYSEICSREDVHVDIPSECTSCSLPNKIINNGDSARITNAPATADIVFVVEERDCADYAANKMQLMVAEMEEALSKKGMRDIRYGLVGFGGEGVHQLPHTQTFDSQTMTTADKFRQGSESLQFSANGDEQDVLAAIRYAAGYRFREGAAKVIILLSCSNCSKNSEDYEDIHGLLRSMDITFHAVMEHNFDLVNQDKKVQTSALFGVDHASVYTIRDARNFKGDKTQYSYVRFPKNQCFSLAVQSKGSFFDLRMLKEKPQVAKTFQRVLALRVASTAEPGDCQVCTCHADPILGQRTVCGHC